jgi:LEA14-like dessication related protein
MLGFYPAFLLRWALAVILLVSLGGCAIFFKAPSVEIVGVQVTSLGISSGTALVELEVTNEQGREMKIRGFLYEVEVRRERDSGSWVPLAEGFSDQNLTIPGHETVSVEVPVPFQYEGIGEALIGLLSAGEVPYRLRGEVWTGGDAAGLQIPFRDEGVIRP